MYNFICNMNQNIISLISALIGGGLTLLGVRHTIKAQEKEQLNNRKLEAKPWLFSFDERQDYDPKKLLTYFMEVGGTYNFDKKNHLTGIIKNTGNGIALLEYVKSETDIYYPSCGNVVEKDALIKLNIVLANGSETLKYMNLYVKDLYGNRYKYKLILNGTSFKLDVCEEV